MSKVGEVQWRLLWEQVGKVYRAAQSRGSETLPEGLFPDPNAEILLRLAGAVLALLDRHAVNAKGRCPVRGCARRCWAPWRKRRACRLFVTVHFWMREPLWIVKKVGKDW
ncbi:MAG: hypothetical protein ACRDTE_11315 [Pseudonocardiaceae bacterium]